MVASSHKLMNHAPNSAGIIKLITPCTLLSKSLIAVKNFILVQTQKPIAMTNSQKPNCVCPASSVCLTILVTCHRASKVNAVTNKARGNN